MSQAVFDALGYFEKLTLAGVPEAQAKVQANAFREFSAVLEESARKELATKGDVREAELRLQKEIEIVRGEIEKVRSEIKSTELRLLKWQIGGWIGLAAIMAKGFGWLGF